MVRYIFITFLSIVCHLYSAQNAYIIVDNGTFHIEDQAIVNVQGHVVNESPLVSINDGQLWLQGDWTNNAITEFLQVPATGTTIFYGGYQTINGNSTSFHNLELDGGSVLKESFCDNKTYGVLNLIDARLETNDNIHFHKNPDPFSVNWNTGYVSSADLAGYFARRTNSLSDYHFPVGSPLLNEIYRPVIINAADVTANEFAVRLAAVDPTFDIGLSLSGATGSFDVSDKDFAISTINTQFYHNIYSTVHRLPYTSKIGYFDADGAYSSVGQWKVNNQWNDLKFATETDLLAAYANVPNRSVSFLIDEEDEDAFSLLNTNDVSNVFVPNSFTPHNSDGINDTFFPVIQGISDIKNYEMLIFNRWGELIFLSNDPNVVWTGVWHSYEAFMGTYVWKISFNGITEHDGKPFTFSEIGHVNYID
jgi:gliding motility-associated-like protein